jgi:hypothetical protein
MCETWEEFGCKPVTLTSIDVESSPGTTVTVPLAVTVGSGLRLNERLLGLGGGWALGRGDGTAPVPLPQAATQSAIAISAIHALADVTAASHRVLALPKQVTGAGWPNRQPAQSLALRAPG